MPTNAKHPDAPHPDAKHPDAGHHVLILGGTRDARQLAEALAAQGLRVTSIKIDPYLNIGTSALSARRVRAPRPPI